MSMMITWRKSLSKHFRRVCKRKVQSINGVREENEKFQMLESWVLIGKLGVIFHHMYIDYTNASRTERKNPNMENMREISWTTWEYCGRREKKKIKNKRFRNIHQRTMPFAFCWWSMELKLRVSRTWCCINLWIWSKSVCTRWDPKEKSLSYSW